MPVWPSAAFPSDGPRKTNPAQPTPQDVHDPLAHPKTTSDEVLTHAEAERRAIVRALRHTGGAKKEAAKVLETSRRTLYNKIRAYGLE